MEYLDDSNFASKTAQGVVLIDFFAPWCGPCRMLAPIVEQVAKEMEGKALVAKVDTDQSPGVATQFGITSIPTLVLLKNGREVKRVIGLRDAQALRAMIETAL